MQIGNVLSSQTDLTSAGKRASNAGTAVASLVEATSSTSTTSTSGVAEVMRKYDLTEITPDEFAEMIQKLHENGSLTDEEYSQLVQLRAEMQSDGLAGDEDLNILTYCEQKCAALQQRADAEEKGSAQRAATAKQLATMQECSEWVQKLQLVHESPDSIGLNATA